MSAWLTGVVTLIYMLVAFNEMYQGRPGIALMFAGYALANLGIIWTMNV